MSQRKPLSKRRRFDAFKRDQFTCQYCGRRPPEVVLEIDHIVAVCDGGSNDEHNLITACFDCNRGKANGTLSATPIDLSGRSSLLKERLEQTKAYDELLQAQRDSEELSIATVVGIYEESFPGWTVADRARPSIRRFLRELPPTIVYEAMELACARMNEDRAFRYFCGVCWNKIGRG